MVTNQQAYGALVASLAINVRKLKTGILAAETRACDARHIP